MTTVAIDGPAGAGKSTVARALADRLGMTYVDTGAMYRAVALAALEQGVDPTDGAAVGDLALRVRVGAAGDKVTLDGRDVTTRIRGTDVTGAAATIAAHGAVRAALVAVQRRAAADGDVVMEGRDIGTKVLPKADVKVFLTASLDERAARRGRDEGVSKDRLSDVAEAIAERDRRDSTRSESPLAKAPDAVELDTTAMPLDEVVATVARYVRRAGGER